MSRRSIARPVPSDDLFHAIADPSRRRILQLLTGRELPLHLISAEFKMRRPSVIKHLRILKAARLVQARRVGRCSIHRLNPAPLRRLKDWAAQFEPLWEQSLKKLKQQVESAS